MFCILEIAIAPWRGSRKSLGSDRVPARINR
jgi:hypothetical protein